MPIYEFECPKGHRYEIIRPISDFDSIKNGIRCEGLSHEALNGTKKPATTYGELCGLTATLVPSIPAKINIGKPTIIFINKQTGAIDHPTSSYTKPPRGYEVVELKNPIDRTKMEKQINERRKVEDEIINERIDYMRNEARKNRHSELRANMGQFDHKEQALLNSAMKRSTNKKRKIIKNKESGFEVNNFDSSNIPKR